MNFSKQLKTQQMSLFSLGGFLDPASQPLVPGSEEAAKMTVGSGKKLSELLEKSNQNGASLKMLRDYLLLSKAWHSTICFLRWKLKATPQKRLLYQLAPSMPHTAGTECGLLATPNAIDSTGRQYQYSQGNHSKKVMCLPGQIQNIAYSATNGIHSLHGNGKKMEDVPIAGKLLPTPRAEKHSPQSREDFTPNLAARIAMCHTPRASDYKGASRHTEIKGRNPMTNSCMDAVENGLNRGLKLHSDFVSYIMGYPLDWMDV